ncbi:FecR family protein [Chitinophaga terrae (ex Kim and Jung 2007)]|jgi:ferric-dicitrate binding protein FerR (iron transport regulator)|uniref:FecR family protein n=1 Tax=Chitinophaga terrae (ex Kim and Jung 2007) TaxID=408074 RepID=A0A1H3YPH7_9BACT|nr:FecR domain-containing protein [Chitinophaga terrae (ex Kim and Jung 2007)]GEP88425.1 hypothetical protein CTE07_00700 [Chitinophaga terrae (ex Kim and Jung 2007)]SEA13267.1 FecR family protein [Chitinophaga terrae (ex Kim and Jung 2007)]
MSFREYTIADFIQEPSFQRWVWQQDAAATAFWEEWLRNNPDKRETVEQAANWLKVMKTATYKPSVNDTEETWSRILRTIETTEKHNKSGLFHLPPIISRRGSRKWIPYAAVLAIIAILYGAAWFMFSREEVKQVTAMGELKTIWLPDSSEVLLNGNSSIRYATGWKRNKPREIWLDGEAFFTVKHLQNNQRFIVHTPDVDVQVTGTEFNVNTRRVKTQVVLNSGEVKLALKQQPDTLIVMKPGDMVTYSVTTRLLRNEKVNPEAYTAWQQRKLVFADTPIAEVVKQIQENLGIEIELEDEKIGLQTFTGIVPIENIDLFFKVLSKSLPVTIEKIDSNKYKINQIN